MGPLRSSVTTITLGTAIIRRDPKSQENADSDPLVLYECHFQIVTLAICIPLCHAEPSVSTGSYAGFAAQVLRVLLVRIHPFADPHATDDARPDPELTGPTHFDARIMAYQQVIAEAQRRRA